MSRGKVFVIAEPTQPLQTSTVLKPHPTRSIGNSTIGSNGLLKIQKYEATNNFVVFEVAGQFVSLHLPICMIIDEGPSSSTSS